MPMSDVSRIRSQLLGRILRRARFGVERLDHLLFEAEIANSTTRLGRSLAESNRLRSAARPCFAMTTGRTGTQTLAALLNVSPSVDAQHEPEPRMIAWAQHQGFAMEGDPAHLLYVLLGCLDMFGHSAEAELVTGGRSREPESLAQYIELVVRLVLPGIPAPEPTT